MHCFAVVISSIFMYPLGHLYEYFSVCKLILKDKDKMFKLFYRRIYASPGFNELNMYIIFVQK